MLPNSRCVDRSSRWGDPYAIQKFGPAENYYVYDRIFQTWRAWTAEGAYYTKRGATLKAISLYREYATKRARHEPEWLDPLRGLDNLYCTCPEGALCHADVLIELLENDA